MPLNYSPWNQAAESVGGTADSISNTALNIAKLRYQQALQQQRQALALGHLALQKQIADAQVGHYGALSAQENSTAQLNQGKLGAASDLANATRNYQMSGRMQGPTLGGQPVGVEMQQNDLADITTAASRSMALHGDAGKLILPHNIPANASAVNPTSGALIGAGPMNIAPGHMYQMPGGPQVVNPQTQRPLGVGEAQRLQMEYHRQQLEAVNLLQRAQESGVKIPPQWQAIVDQGTNAAPNLSPISAPTGPMNVPQLPTSQAAPSAPPPTTEELVPMINPQGKEVRIPKSYYNAAMQQGYTPK